MSIYTPIQEYLEEVLVESSSISDERKQTIEPIISYIADKIKENKNVQLVYICTHNSRRSQFSQIWSQVLSYYHGISTSNYSGGVEVTAFNERAVKTLSEIGFKIEKKGQENPHYSLKFSENANLIAAFSKTYNDASNPIDNFATIMTCSHADKNCPVIFGAEARIPLRYEDPKAFDDTENEANAYQACSKQIATEMCYLFSEVKRRIA